MGLMLIVEIAPKEQIAIKINILPFSFEYKLFALSDVKSQSRRILSETFFPSINVPKNDHGMRRINKKKKMKDIVSSYFFIEIIPPIESVSSLGEKGIKFPLF